MTEMWIQTRKVQTWNPFEFWEPVERSARASVQVAAHESNVHASEGDSELAADRIAALRQALERDATARLHLLLATRYLLHAQIRL